MGKYKYLFGNMALFTVSNFVSKILVFLLVPFYTHVLSTGEYGVGDVMHTTLLLLVPALTVNMGEGALRFAIERERERGDILRIGLKRTGISIGMVGAVCGAVSLFTGRNMKIYLLFFVFLYAANAFFEYFILFFQGCEKVKIVVLGSVSCTVLTLASNLYFLLVAKIGLYGYLLSQILSFGGAACLMFCLGGGKKYWNLGKKNKGLEREIMNYGKPMILYSTSSWANNAADRYIIMWMCGTSVGGVYGIANKIPAMLTVFQRIFAQAWQMSASKNYQDKESGEFFSSMYQSYNMMMVLGSSVLVIFCKVLAKILFAKDFYEAWSLVPPLVISVIFGALSGFLGSICLAYKDSKGMGKAAGTGALFNIILNPAAVYFLGAMGAAIITALSYYVMYAMAFLTVRKYVRLTWNWKRDYLSYFLIIVQSFCLIWEVNGYRWINGILLLCLVFFYRKELTSVLKNMGTVVCSMRKR